MRRALAAALAGVALLAGCGSAGAPPPAAEPAVAPPLRERPAGRLIPVGGMPEGLAVDPATGIVAIGLRNPDELALVRGTRVRRVHLPESPRHLALERPGGPVLMPAERADALARVALPGGRVESVTPAGRFPHDAAASGGRVLVTDEMGNAVSIFAGARRVATVHAPLQPGGAVPLPGGLAAVVAVRARVLAVYRLAPPGLVTEANAGVGPTHAAAALGRVYVADTQGDAVLEFRTSPRLGDSQRHSAARDDVDGFHQVRLIEPRASRRSAARLA